MSYTITDREYQASLQLNSDYREHQFFNNIMKGLEIFVLRKDENVLMLSADDSAENSNSTILPIWCHEKYAEYYANNVPDESLGKNHEPKAVTLGVFIEKWLPELSKLGVELAIFPLTNDKDCNIITIEDFQTKLDDINTKKELAALEPEEEEEETKQERPKLEIVRD